MRKTLLLIMSLLLSTVCMNAQIKLSGTVRDAETSEVLPGATVMIENSQSGAKANEKGYFEIKTLKEGEAVIKISYVGYETLTKNVNLKGETVINVDLYKSEILADQIVVTASRSKQMISDIAGRISLVSNRGITSTPNLTVDDIIKSIPGINVDRESGMFTSSVTVNIRGITSSEQGRVLTMIDGEPINKTDGGTVNWNRINPETIDRIEIFKGPGSSLYGNNAMGGVINFISKKNEISGYHAYAGSAYGTLNSFSQEAGVSGKLDAKDGLSFSANVFNRSSDGYNTYSAPTIFNMNSNLKETGFDGRVQYDFNDKTNIALKYNFYDDNRGQGTKVYEENYMKQRDNYSSLIFNTEFSNIKLNASLFYQCENYLRTSEKYKISNNQLVTSSYSCYHTDADRVDLGANASLTIPVSFNTILAGVEIKRGSIDGADNYVTSTDRVINKGHMDFLAAFAQDNMSITDKLTVLAGLRLDYINFADGEFSLVNPTSTTSFMSGFTGAIPETNWTSLTPKISAQYKFNEDISTYLAYSRGFRAATLDDLTRCGQIKQGFKNANPNLKPETIDNYEIGLNYNIGKVFYIMPSIYYLHGNDFMAYISTGKTTPINGTNKPIIIKDNISQVQFYGIDLDVRYFMSANLYAFANYTFSKSQILDFSGNSALIGKELTYTPDHLINFGITYLNPVVNATLILHYQSKQFTADDNSLTDTSGNPATIPDGITCDVKIWKKFFNMLNVNLEVENIGDVTNLTTYDRVSLGRMIIAGLSIEI